MIKVENIETWGFEHAVRGMRNPLNSWDKSDSNFDIGAWLKIGDNDLGLMRRLYKAGTEHRKYARQIFVSMDITAPLYFFKEWDTYKVGTTSNSCSTMHKIHSKEFTLDDFSCEQLNHDNTEILQTIIKQLNVYRYRYNRDKLKSDWWQMIQLLPSSYNQRRTITMTYENVFSILKQRKGHKLDEWNDFCEVLMGLPYLAEITGEKNEE